MHHETHVVVPVLGFVAAGGNAVAVDVEDHGFATQPRQARLLLGLAQRHCSEVGIPVGVPAKLQPAPQLAVQGQQCAPAAAVDQPARCREVAVAVAAGERLGCLVQELREQRGLDRAVRMPRDEAGECAGEVEPMGH